MECGNSGQLLLHLKVCAWRFGLCEQFGKIDCRTKHRSLLWTTLMVFQWSSFLIGAATFVHKSHAVWESSSFCIEGLYRCLQRGTAHRLYCKCSGTPWEKDGEKQEALFLYFLSPSRLRIRLRFSPVSSFMHYTAIDSTALCNQAQPNVSDIFVFTNSSSRNMSRTFRPWKQLSLDKMT